MARSLNTIKFFGIQNYNIVRRDRNRKKGGVLIGISNYWAYIKIDILNTSEILAIDLVFNPN